jgi:TrmH family RNA methyltransferase
MSKSLFKLYRSLKHREVREQFSLFAAETPKVILDLIKNNIRPHSLFIIKEKIPEWQKIISDESLIYPVSSKQLEAISHLKTPNEICGIFHIPKIPPFNQHFVTPILDDVADPANLGLILRTCHWYGIHHILATPDTVDAYNLKTVMSSKGSIAQVHVHYKQPNEILHLLSFQTKIYKADLNGDSIMKPSISFPLAFIIGNEGHGIKHFSHIQETITIPTFSNHPPNSLNAAISSAILIHTFFLYKFLNNV